MKKILMIPYFLLALFFVACEEDIREPLLNDGAAPGPVSNVEVENVPGGAWLSYTLPTDNDVLYILAEYELANGKVGSVKSTIYRNMLKVEGFGDTNAKNVTLYAVDRGENKSAPVSVTINPLEPPVQAISKTISIIPDFGGAHFYWDNETEAEVAVIVMTHDTTGHLYQADIRYSSQLAGDFAVRGYNTDEREFVVILRDRWDNFSDTVRVSLNPLYEEVLDKNKFEFLELPHDAPSAWGWVGPNLFNNSIGGGGFHTPQGWTDPDPLPEYPEHAVHMFTMDLGVTAKLSRWKFWQRQGSWAFKWGNPRFFDVWGAKELNPDGTFNGWVKLIENGEVVKPSGLPPGQLTNEDKEQAANGEEFSFPLDADPVRYIRFVSLESWSGARFMHFMEVDFWGEVQN